MPTRKQRRRALKERRHQYETVWVDSEGNELEGSPAGVLEAPGTRDTSKPKTKAKSTQQQRGGRPLRIPQPPSWERAARRSLILGVCIFAVVYLLGSKGGGHSIGATLILAGLYAVLFIPLGYTVDRFTYNRFQRREGQQAAKRPAKKR
jgi:hypothetical protein